MKPTQRYLPFNAAPSTSKPSGGTLPSRQPPPSPPDTGPNHEGKTPYPYQVHGIKWLASRKKALLADEMGLGKTVQALRAVPRTYGGIIVAPASLKLVWRDEILRWRPDLHPMVMRPGEFIVPTAGEVTITSYESLPEPQSRNYLIHDARVNQCWLIVDEAHYCKHYSPRPDRGAFRAKKVSLLSKQCLRTYLLTGTPLMGKPRDLWGLLNCFNLERDVFGEDDPYGAFTELFGAEKKVIRKKGGQVIKFTEFPDDKADMPGLDIVKNQLSKVALRRLKKQVLPDLPSKTYQTIPVELTEELKPALDYVGSQWVDNSELPPFEMLSQVRAMLADSRIPALLEQVERFEESKCPLIVFSAHRRPVEALGGRPGWGVITGDTAPEFRRTQVDLFQNGMLCGLALTIGAGGLGITLTRASNVLFVDLAYTPAENMQAEDRVVRIGQKAQGVFIMRMVADHPVDRRVLEILDQKAGLIAATTGGELKGE